MAVDASQIGVVEDVSGSTLSVRIDANLRPGLFFVGGSGYRVGQPGSFVRVPLGYMNLFGLVSEVGVAAIPERLKNLGAEPIGQRWISVQLVGEGAPTSGFSRGVSQYPTVGDAVHIVSQEDLRTIYGRPDSPEYLDIGAIASAESIPALVNINGLVNRHACVVGSTGSGKSTAVAGLLNSIAQAGRFESARVLLFDIHGEYAAALGSSANVFRIAPSGVDDVSPLYLPYWALEFEELMPIAFGEDLNDVDRGGVADYVRKLKLEALETSPRPGVEANSLSVDTPVPFSIHRLWYELYQLVVGTHLRTGNQDLTSVAFRHDEHGIPVDRGDADAVRAPDLLPQDTSSGASPKVFLSQSPLNIRRQLQSLGYRLRDPRFAFLFDPGPWRPTTGGMVASDLDALIREWVGGPMPVTILDLSGVPREVLNVVVGVFVRIIYDALFWARNLAEGGRERPLLVVLEEAHAYLAKDEGSSAARTVRRIIREGRKYGIGLMIVSQRPSEIDDTILSQCGTYFSFRLGNSRDRNHVAGVAPDDLEGLFRLLPSLRTGEVIIVGEAVHLPMRVMVREPQQGRRPESDDPKVFESNYPGGWNRQRGPESYEEVVQVWRRKDPRSPSVHDLDADASEVQE